MVSGLSPDLATGLHRTVLLVNNGDQAPFKLCGWFGAAEGRRRAMSYPCHCEGRRWLLLVSGMAHIVGSGLRLSGGGGFLH